MSETLEPSPNETSISDFLRTVEAGQDIKDALVEWQKKNTGRLKVEALRKNLFAEEPQVERHSSGSLQATAVIRAIETEKKASEKRRRKLQKIRLEALVLDEEPETRLMLNVLPETGYHVVIEKNRPFSLKMTDPNNSTLALMELACLGCFETKKHWPTCILIRTERFYKLVYNLRWYTIEGRRIPFDCAPDDADYDVMAVHDEVTEADEWMRDRKIA